MSYSPQKSKAKRLTAELCGNIPAKGLVKPLRPPGMGSGEIATFHYGQIFTIGFWVYLYENGTGHTTFKYQTSKEGISYEFDETFNLEGKRIGFKKRGWKWNYVCKCKRRTRILFIGWDNSIGCRYCFHVRTSIQQHKTWKDVVVARDPTQLKRLIRTAYTPYKKSRAIRIYIDFLRRTMKAIRSKYPGVYLKHFKK